MVNLQKHNQTAQKWWNGLYRKNRDYFLEGSPFTMSEARRTEWDAIYSAFDSNSSQYKKIIDFGCGTGHFAFAFIMKGFDVTGIDLSQAALDIVRKKAQKYKIINRLHLLNSGLFKEIKRLENKFDAGYMIVTYQCISNKDQKKVFKNFVKLIKKGGKILIMEPNPLNPLFYLFYLRAYKNNLYEAANVVNSRKEILLDLFKETGLRNITVYRHSFLPTSLINRWSWIKNINRFLCSIPLVNNFCAFHIITATKP